MNKSEEIERNWRVAGAIMGMIISALSQGLNIFSLWPQAPWGVFAFVSFLVFCAFVWLLIRNLLKELSSKTPNIDVSSAPIINDVQMNFVGPSEDGSGKPAQFLSISNMAHIQFANNPKPITDSNSAKDVRAEITFYDIHRNVLLGPIEGRWGETEHPTRMEKGEQKQIESIDFPNNGAKRHINLIIKYPEDEFCYAYNNESYLYKDFQKTDFIIKSTKFIASIVLKGAYIPSTPWEFVIETRGFKDSFRISYKGQTVSLNSTNAKKHVSVTPVPPLMPTI